MAWYGRDYADRGGRDRMGGGYSGRFAQGPRYDRGWGSDREDWERVRYRAGGHGGGYGRDWDDRLREGWNDLKRGFRNTFGGGHGGGYEGGNDRGYGPYLGGYGAGRGGYDRGYPRRGTYSGRQGRGYDGGWW